MRTQSGLCFSGVALLATLAGGRTAHAGDGLAPRPPERLVIESRQRVSDGRTLQREADQSLRKADEPPPAPPPPPPRPAPQDAKR
jgi:hypothetical protein